VRRLPDGANLRRLRGRLEGLRGWDWGESAVEFVEFETLRGEIRMALRFEARVFGDTGRDLATVEEELMAGFAIF